MEKGRIAVEAVELKVVDSTETMVQARLWSLGAFSLELARMPIAALPTQKARALLAYLVAHRRSVVGRETLLERFWPEAIPEAAKDGLRSALWAIRRSIKDAGLDPDDYLMANRTVVRWTARTWLDSEAFLELAGSEDPLELEAAADLYRGDFLEGDYDEWCVSERARFSDAYDSVLSRLVEKTRGRDAAQLLLARNPYHEASYIALIERDLAEGRFVSAAALAERCERALRELGIEPSESLRRLVAGISLRQMQSVARISLPFVGREFELSRMRSKFESADGARTVVISGVAGIGKSALLARIAELAKSLGRAVISVRCFDTDSRPFGPFEDFTLDATDREALVTIDDAHTLSGDALRILKELVDRAPSNGPLLVVATRTEGVAPLSSVLPAGRYETVALGPLRSEDLQSAVGAVVYGDSQTLASAIFERSAGHPLFAATLLESLAQSGVLRSDRGSWQLTGTLDERVALPRTLTTYIQARLRTRGELPLLVAAALALEPAGSPADIAVVLGSDEAQVLDALDDLLALGILVQPSGTQLAFAHDLYREVASNALNAGRRSRIHRMFAERFESSTGSDTSALRARHLTLAGEPVAASEAYVRAAQEALKCNAFAEARDRCAAGIIGMEPLERTPVVDGELARLKALRARAESELGEINASNATAQDAIFLAKRVGDTVTALSGMLTRQANLLEQGDAPALLRSAQEAANLAREARDDSALSKAFAAESCGHRLLGDEAHAMAAARESHSAALAAHSGEDMLHALLEMALCGVTWWRFEAASEAARQALAFETQSGWSSRAFLFATFAFLNLALRRHDAARSAIACARAALEQAAGQQARQVWTAVISADAQLALACGDYEGALRLCNELDSKATPRSAILAALFRAEAHFERGTAESVTQEVSNREVIQDVLSGTRSPEIACTLAAVTARNPDAPERVLAMLDRIEAASRRSPLDADSAFAMLSRAAERCGALAVAHRALLRSKDYSDARALAASRIREALPVLSKNA